MFFLFCESYDLAVEIPDRFPQVRDFMVRVFKSCSGYVFNRISAIKIHALRDCNDLYWICVLVVGRIYGIVGSRYECGHVV